MAATEAPPALLEGLLEGLDVVTFAAEEIAQVCAQRGARLHSLRWAAGDEDALNAAVRALPGADVLVCDAAPGLRAAGGGPDALASAVAATWAAARAVLAGRMQATGYGLILLVAPRPRDGGQAGAARAALENLARTTAVEWARLGVRVVAVNPGDATPDAAIAALLAYLASPAGAYFSGCVFELGAAGLSGSVSASS